MSNPIGRGLDLHALRQKDPFGAAHIDKFIKEQERKRAFLEEMMRKLPPGVWGALGQFITEAVIKAPGDQLDKVFADIEAAVANFIKSGSTAALGRMGLDALLNVQHNTVLGALEQVEKFLGSAAPTPGQEA